jgi:hypothetical protein
MIALLLVLPLMMLSCYPESDLGSVEDYDVVITLFDPEVDFGAIQTYAMPDSVVHVGDDEGIIDNITRQYDALILGEVAHNMEALGYARIADPEQNPPDVFLAVAVSSSRWVDVYQYYPWYDYWGWYPGWGYYPGYYPYYGYPVTEVTTYTSGSLVINMLDFENLDEAEERIPLLWAAAVNGLLEDTSEGIRGRIVANTQQCFRQSPYLGRD